jgi:hypothetical protein
MKRSTSWLADRGSRAILALLSQVERAPENFTPALAFSAITYLFMIHHIFRFLV